MKKFLLYLVFGILTLLSSYISAQEVIFTATENNLGLTANKGQFGSGFADYDGDGDMDFLHVLCSNKFCPV